MQVFNPNNLRNKQRFPVAIVVGILSSIICAAIIGMITVIAGWYISLIYLAAAFGIGSAIKYVGRGVDIKFSILSVLCFVLCVFLSDFFMVVNSLSLFSIDILWYSIQGTLHSFSDVSIQGLIRVVIIVYAGYLSYYFAKII